MPTLQGFSSKNPADMQKVAEMVFRKPTPEELEMPAPAVAAAEIPETSVKKSSKKKKK